MDYMEIYNSMEFGKAYKASDLNVASASMTAMVRRGLVEKINTKPLSYKKKINNTSKILELLKQNSAADYFVIFIKGQKLGMMCSLKNGSIVDCYGKVYDASAAEKLRVFEPLREFVL